MDLFNLFSQKLKKVPVSGIKVGDWVTQYSAGYWKVVAIFPKYADADYSYNGISWKKGDRLGDWIVLKKGSYSQNEARQCLRVCGWKMV